MIGRETTAQRPLVIKPSSGWAPLNFQEIWAYRELIYFLTWRDVKVRYKQTALGIAWAVIQPLALMIVFSVFFGHLAKVPSDGLPYPIFALAGLLPWQLFARALSECSNSLVVNERLITKVYFPRLIVPLSAVLSGVVDFFLALLVLIGLMLYYGVAVGSAIWTLPFFTALLFGAALAVGLWLSALNVRYRDVRYAVPFLIQIWLFVSPVAYPTSIVPAVWRSFYGLNPMVGIIEGFRWALLGSGEGVIPLSAISGIVIGLLLIGGAYYFRRTEKTFADFV